MNVSPMLENFTTRFCVMDKTKRPDGEGGSITTYTEGMEFDAIVRHDTTIEAQVAEQAGTASTYTFLIDKGMSLEYPDYVKRMSDGQTYQITSDSSDEYTPSTSALNLRSVTARKQDLPS